MLQIVWFRQYCLLFTNIYRERQYLFVNFSRFGGTSNSNTSTTLLIV